MAASISQVANVKPFDGNGYSNWEFRVKLCLEQHGVLEVIETEPPQDPADLASFKKNDVKARNIIVQFLADNVLEMVKSKRTAKEIMEELSGTFKTQGIANQIMLQRKLRNMKFTGKEKLSTFLFDFEKTITEIKNSGGSIDNSEIITQLLAAMPESYQVVSTAIDVVFCQGNTNITLDFVKNKLLMEESRQEKQREEQSGEEVQAFVSKKKNFKKYQGKTRENYSEKSEFPFKCYNCGEKGHKRVDCKKKRVEKQQKFVGNVAETDENEDIAFLSSENVINSNRMNEISFVIDSGATNHLITSKAEQFLTDIINVDLDIKVAKQGEVIKAYKQGNLCLLNTNGMKIKLKDVLVCRNLSHNLMSVKRIEQSKLKVIFENGIVSIMKQEKKITQGKLVGNLYYINFEIQMNEVNLLDVDNDLMHRRMGHSSMYPTKSICETCLQGKQTKLSYRSLEEERKPKRMFEVVSSDVCGPITPISHDGKRYFVLFIDHYSHFTVGYTLTHKNEVFEKFKTYLAMIKTKFSCNIKHLRCDNGGEYISKNFKELCQKEGIEVQYTIPYNPQQNGIAERYNRTVMERARCLIYEANIDKKFWSEAILTAIYLINRTRTTVLKADKTPAEHWYQRKLNLDKIKVFGCDAYVHVPKEERHGKLDAHSRKMILMGYTANGYRLWDPKKEKIITSRDVIFDEKLRIKTISGTVQDIDQEVDLENIEDQKNNSSSEEDQDITNEIRKSTRKRQKPKYLENYDVDFESNLMAALTTGNLLSEVPESFEEAIKDKNWKTAIDEELNSLKERETWQLVELPENEEIIDSKWVFREKIINSVVVKKARLVARGFKQSALDEEVYAPVARLATIRVLLSLYLELNLYVQQLDVNCAFLYGTLQNPVFMKQPEGLNENPKLICKLTKSLYGLKQAPKTWNDLFHKKLTDLGLQRSKKDPCFYFNQVTFLLVYVDDVILFSKHQQNLDYIKLELSKDFKMKEFENSKLMFLGLEIKKYENELYITQKDLIRKTLDRFNMTQSKFAEIPMQSKLQLKIDDNVTDVNLPYRELIGCLMYIMLGSRPDLCYCVTYFSQFQNNYSQEHWKHLKQVLRYLNQTKDYGLKFTKSYNSEITLKSYVDADFANNVIDRKSISGFVIKLNNNVIFWKTKKQNVVTLSSAESEYVALSLCITENLYLGQMLSEILNINVFPITIYEDNQSCIKMAMTFESKRTKHIDIKHHFIRDCIRENKVKLLYISTEMQQADIFTKALPKIKFCYFRDCLNVVLV